MALTDVRFSIRWPMSPIGGPDGGPAHRFDETGHIEPTDLMLRRRVAPSRSMEAGTSLRPSFETLTRSQACADCVNLSALLAPQDEVDACCSYDSSFKIAGLGCLRLAVHTSRFTRQ
jgi:hypothetical protein